MLIFEGQLLEIVWWTVLAVLNNLITSFTELLYSHLSFMSISTLHFTPVTQTQRERSTVLTSTNERSSLLESSSLSILPSLSTLINFCTVAASPLMASSLSSLQCSLHFLCFYIWYYLFFPSILHLSMYPSMILCHSLAALALSAALHPLAGLWKNTRGRMRARENPTDSVRCVNYNKINFMNRYNSTAVFPYMYIKKPLCQDYLSKHVFFWEHRIK